VSMYVHNSLDAIDGIYIYINMVPQAPCLLHLYLNPIGQISKLHLSIICATYNIQ
jgi:hypothetical protein